MKILFAIPEGPCNILAISGAIAILEAAQGPEGPFFQVQVGRMETDADIDAGRFHLQIDVALNQVRKVDLILLPSILGSISELVEMNKKMVDWLSQMHVKKDVQIASLCTGSYLLAAAGLLDGKEASCHWKSIPALKKMYPNVNWMPEKIITDNRGIYTSGGAISSFNLLFYLVEKYINKESAHLLAKFFEVSYPLPSQAPFIIFNNQKTHGDEAILQVQNYMEKHLAHSLSADLLSHTFNMSKRNFIRRFKLATQTTPGKYLQQLRVEQAKRILESSNAGLMEVMLEVGYNDMNSFRSVFYRYAGYMPSEYKKVFGQANKSNAKENG